MVYYLNDDSQLIDLLSTGAFIHILNNGQMTLSTDSSIRLDIIMVYDLINRNLLRIAERTRIVLSEVERGMTLLQIAGEIQDYLTRFEQDPDINRLLRAGPAFYRPKVKVQDHRVLVWYRGTILHKPYRLTRAQALLYLTRLRSGWIREHWWPADETAYGQEDLLS